MTSDMTGVEILARLRPGTFARRSDRLPPQAFRGVPSRELVTMVLRLIASQGPLHDPRYQPLPAWVDEWMQENERGVDMTQFFSSPAPTI